MLPNNADRSCSSSSTTDSSEDIVNIVINVDGGYLNEVLEIAKDFQRTGWWISGSSSCSTFKNNLKNVEKDERQKRRGNVSIVKYKENRGLGRAWFEAWTPESDTERALILEDDVEVSPYFYLWLKRAWDAYGTQRADRTTNEEASVVPDLAGISLQRQTLIPTVPPIWNRHLLASKYNDPYHFKLVGSIGFSPNAKYWRELVPWAGSLDVETANVGMKNLIVTK